MLAHRLRRWANISPVLVYCVVFIATLNVGAGVTCGGSSLTQLWLKACAGTASMPGRQHEVLTRAEWILASTDDAGPTFKRHWVCVGLYSPPAVCTARPAAQQTRGVEPVLVWCWASAADGGPELDQHWSTSRVCWECWQATFCFAHRLCEDIKTVAQLIEPKDDLVTVDIKTGSTTSKYIVSTVHRSHLITLITKAIDTTSISYQSLWLCCWGETSSVFCLQKTRLL